jgi:hypothetical protein
LGKYPLATVRIKADFVRPVFSIALFKASYSSSLSLTEKVFVLLRILPLPSLFGGLGVSLKNRICNAKFSAC